jgi:predicted ATPase
MSFLKQIDISGYKSIESMPKPLELGRINVLIGANGSGKSNLLSFFKLLKSLPGGDLQNYVNQKEGGANNILHYGAKRTPKIHATLELEDGAGDKYRYSFILGYAANDRLIFEDERYTIFQKVARNEYETKEVCFGGGHWESQLNLLSDTPKSGENTLHKILNFFRVYHFNDTSLTAQIRQNTMFGNMVPILREGANNLAHILHQLSLQAPSYYSRIVETIKQIMPGFRDFVFHPNPDGIVQLNWRGEDPEYVFSSHQTPDGALRAMALITLLLQSTHSMPRVIAIDEPELGLHPNAICIIAALLKQASLHCQVIIATQSPTLLDEFDPEDVIVVDRKEDQSTFTRLSPDKLKEWLEEYSLGELWQKNVLGGGPMI